LSELILVRLVAFWGDENRSVAAPWLDTLPETRKAGNNSLQIYRLQPVKEISPARKHICMSFNAGLLKIESKRWRLETPQRVEATSTALPS
jgi:hypothetical protein